MNITGQLFGIKFNNEPVSLKANDNSAYALCILAFFGQISIECKNRTTEYQIFGKNWDELNSIFEQVYNNYDGLTFEQEKRSARQWAICYLWDKF